MIIEILMPALSPTMTDGILSKWFKKEGDKIIPGEVIAEIETDKATMEVEAVDEGIIGKILITQGTANIPVGSTIALVLEEGDDKSLLDGYKIKGSKHSATKIEEKKEHIIEAPKQQQTSNERIFASPLAKRIAEDKSIDLRNISGSGPHGRIVKSDVLEAKTCTKPASLTRDGGYSIEPHSNVRKVIAKRLLESKLTVPHFYLNINCNLDKLLEIRLQINSMEDAKHKISVNDFIIKASAMALAKVPHANSSWSDDGIIRYHDVDIAVAVAIDGGLVTPLVRNADQKSLIEISNEMKILASRARDGKLKPDEYQGGSFTISNLGMFGIKQFAAIINPPQSCILAVGSGEKTPVVDGDKIKISTIAEMTLSCDHRVVDGAIGAQFLAEFKSYIENPIKMFLQDRYE